MSSYLQFRARIRQAIGYGRSSVTFDLRQCDCPQLPQTFKNSGVPHHPFSIVIAHRTQKCVTSSLATAAAIDRVVHHSGILEFDVPSYRTDAAQQRGETAAAEEVNRQY